MTSKERMLAALNRETPDRLPITLHQWQGYHLEKYLGGISDLEAFRKFGLDAWWGRKGLGPHLSSTDRNRSGRYVLNVFF